MLLTSVSKRLYPSVTFRLGLLKFQRQSKNHTNYYYHHYYGRSTVPLFRRRAALSTKPLVYGIRVRAFHSVAVSVGRQLSSFCVYGASSGQKSYVTAVKKSKVEMPEVKQFERLPTSVVPKHYGLVLTPDLKTFTFKGEVAIQIQVFVTYAVVVSLICLCKLSK